MTEEIDYRDLIGPNWIGECVFCGAMLGPADWEKGRVVGSLVDTGALPVVCFHHVQRGRGKECRAALRALARAIVREVDGPAPFIIDLKSYKKGD